MTRVGIIGLGRIGFGFGVAPSGDPLCHAEAYARCPEVEVAVGVEPHPEARARFAARFPRARVVENVASLADQRLDIVSIASPTVVHEDSVLQALQLRPKVLLVEKPLAQDLAGARRLVAACQAAHATMLVNYSRRFAPMLQIIQAQRAAGEALDGMRGASVRYSGGLVHNGTHWIDLLLAIFGPGATGEITDGAVGDDPADSMVLRWPSGAVAHLIAVRGAGWSVGEGELWGPNGVVRFSAGGRLVTRAQPRPSAWVGFPELAPAEVLTDDGMRGHLQNAAMEAVQLARHGGVPRCSGEDGLRALALVEQARDER